MDYTFYDKIDNMLKEILDHPVPQFLLEENRRNHQAFLNLNEEFNGKLYLKNFLISYGYKLDNEESTPTHDLVMIYDRDNNPRRITFKQTLCVDSDSKNLENEKDKLTSDFHVFINPVLSTMFFVSPKSVKNVPMT